MLIKWGWIYVDDGDDNKDDNDGNDDDDDAEVGRLKGQQKNWKELCWTLQY